MEEVKITDKQKYLNEHYPFSDLPKLEDIRECIHCGNTFKVKNYKVYRNIEGDEIICCPFAPDCDGTVIEWFPLENDK